jgi:hypothetical protein
VVAASQVVRMPGAASSPATPPPPAIPQQAQLPATTTRPSTWAGLLVPPPPAIPTSAITPAQPTGVQDPRIPTTHPAIPRDLPMPTTHPTAFAPVVRGASASSGVQHSAIGDADTRMAQLLDEVSSNRPVAIRDPVIADADPQEVALMQQLAVETVGRGDAAITCREAQTVFRAASVERENPLRGVGQPPRLFETVPRASLANPDTYAKAWRVYANELTKLHVDRHYPEWSKHVSNDHENSCDVLVALDTKNTRTLAGWVMCPEQSLFLCNANGQRNTTARTQRGVC